MNKFSNWQITLLIFVFTVFNYSCFVTTYGYVKHNDGKILVSNDKIPLSINVMANEHIDNKELSDYLKSYLKNYNRVPPFDIWDSSSDDCTTLDIYVKSVISEVYDIDKTVEKQEEEKDAYKKRVEDYEKEKKIAEEFKKEPPPEVEKPKEETVSYKVRNISFKYSIEVVIGDESNDYLENINSIVSKEVVLEHKKRNINRDAIFSFTPTGNILADMSATLVTGFLNFLFTDKTKIEKYKDDETQVMAELRKRLFNDMAVKIVTSVEPYFIKFIRNNITLMSIDKRTDLRAKEILNDEKEFIMIFDYFTSLLEDSVDDRRARILFNLSILYFYYKDDEKSLNYYNLGNKEKFGIETANMFNSILPILGKDYLKDLN